MTTFQWRQNGILSGVTWINSKRCTEVYGGALSFNVDATTRRIFVIDDLIPDGAEFDYPPPAVVEAMIRRRATEAFAAAEQFHTKPEREGFHGGACSGQLGFDG